MQSQYPQAQNPQFPQPSPPGAAPPPKKKTNWLLYVGGGCLGLTIMCCVLPVSGFFVGNSVLKSHAEDTVAQFTAAGQRRDGAAVYGMLDSFFRMSTSVVDVQAGLANCPGLSTHTSYEVTEVRVDHPFDDFLIVRVRYQTPAGPLEGSIGVENQDSMHIGTYNEYGGADSMRCNLRRGLY